MNKDIINLDSTTQINLLSLVWDLEETVNTAFDNQTPQEVTDKFYEVIAALRYSGIITKFKVD